MAELRVVVETAGVRAPVGAHHGGVCAPPAEASRTCTPGGRPVISRRRSALRPRPAAPVPAPPWPSRP